MANRVYLVAEKRPAPGSKPRLRLVRASHSDRALRLAALDHFEVRVASQDDLIAALAAGAKVEVPEGAPITVEQFTQANLGAAGDALHQASAAPMPSPPLENRYDEPAKA